MVSGLSKLIYKYSRIDMIKEIVYWWDIHCNFNIVFVIEVTIIY